MDQLKNFKRTCTSPKNGYVFFDFSNGRSLRRVTTSNEYPKASLLTTSDRSGTRNPSSEFWKCDGEMGLRQVGFSSFFAMLDDFPKWSMPKRAVKLSKKFIKYDKNNWQKMKKSLVQLTIQPLPKF